MGGTYGQGLPHGLGRVQRVDGGAATHRRLVDELVRAVRDVQTPAAVAEGRDPELRVPPGLEHARAQLEAGRPALDRLDAAGELDRLGVRLVGRARRLLLEDVDRDRGAGALGGRVDGAGETGELRLEGLLGVEAPV